jgi:VCBS repeat-containing protein
LATVVVTIAPVNDAPVASDGTLAVTEDRAEIGMLIGADVDGDALTFAVVGAPTKGTITITNAATGRYTYTPNPDAFGSDAFTFEVTDGTGNSNLATVTIAIAGNNDAPAAQDTAFSTVAGVALTAALPATDPDADPLTFTIAKNPKRGTITSFDAATGAFTYVPDAGFSGTDTFTFRVSDGVKNSALATVMITVLPASPVFSPSTDRQ